MMKHILLVDDNLTNLKQAASLLKDKYRVSMVKSGEQALDFLGKYTPDLIFMDVEMPNMDGYETTRRIKAMPKAKRIPIIFLTGDHDVESEVKGFECGAVDYMTKPFSKEIMLHRVGLHLELFEYQQNLEMVLEEKTKELMENLQQTERIRAELDLASKLQQNMLPTEFPRQKEFKIYAKMIPAKEVGGDMYDFLVYDERYLVIAIGDASGKGIGAAMFMTQAKMMLSHILNEVLINGHPLEDGMSELNNSISKNNTEDLFLTLFVGILDLQTGEMKYCNAGHNPPLIHQEGGHFHLFECNQNFILGGLENTVFQCNTIQLYPGARLFFYTDGVTELYDSQGTMYGEERLIDTLEIAEKNNCLIEEAAETVFSDLRRFSVGVEQPDDITVLLLRYDGFDKE